VERLLRKPVPVDGAEFSFLQNPLDNVGIPSTEYIDKSLLEKVKEMTGNEQLQHLMTNFRARFTQDPETLAQLDHSKLQTPGFRNESEAARAKRHPHPLMDRITVRQNLFVEI
jgi:hypothetical protein